MPITPLNGDLTAGIAGSYTETINPGPSSLVSGDTPALFTTTELVLTSQDLAARTVVGFNADGKLVPASLVSTVVQAIGVLLTAVNSAGGDRTAEVIRGGCLNPDLLVWPGSYDTDEKKRKAFYGAPAPTQIIIRKPTAMSV